MSRGLSPCPPPATPGSAHTERLYVPAEGAAPTLCSGPQLGVARRALKEPIERG